MNPADLRDTWLMFQREHDCSVDRMLCNPDLREKFLAAARLVIDDKDDQNLLWALVAMRKRKPLPRAQQS